MDRNRNTGCGALIFGVMIIIVAVVFIFCTCTVPAGYVAVQYNMSGGVQDKVLTQGFHIVSPTVHTTLYTVGLEQSYLTAGKQGDSKEDDSFSACSSEGKDLRIDLTFTYQYQPENVAEIFTRFKGQSGVDVRDSFIKPNIVSWTKEVVARYKVSDILGAQRAEVNHALNDYLADKFANYGITISNVSLINIEVDDETSAAISSKINAQQKAETQAIQNKTNIDKATADAEAARIAAQGKADALLIEAEAEAAANRLLNESLNEDILTLEFIDKWNGALPQFTGGDGQLLFNMPY